MYKIYKSKKHHLAAAVRVEVLPNLLCTADLAALLHCCLQMGSRSCIIVVYLQFLKFIPSQIQGETFTINSQSTRSHVNCSQISLWTRYFHSPLNSYRSQTKWAHLGLGLAVLNRWVQRGHKVSGDLRGRFKIAVCGSPASSS